MNALKIKKIEIQGFKSFSDKQVLELNPRTNVIVGPNGSGKSNLIDAVNWVLGEQSLRSLRGERMEDIIFSGSAARKPVGMAQVVLHLDNSDGYLPLDYHEITITRRFFRSGESQFLINKIPCRLRDIRELFIGTGSGRGSLAIISQGQVDRVLNSKPSYRREVLEEAAGISKYRLRCQEAKTQLSKIEEDAANLSRLGTEIQHNMNLLRVEAEKASRYLELREERDYLESLILTKKARDLFLDTARCRWRLEELSLGLEKAGMQEQFFLKRRDGLVQELQTINKRKERAARERVRLEVEYEHLTDKLNIARERKSWLQGRIEECAAFLESSRKDLNDLATRQAADLESYRRLGLDIQKCSEEYAQLKEKAEENNREIKNNEEKSKRVNAFYVELLSEQAKIGNNISAAKKEIERIEAEKEKTNLRLEELRQGREELRRKIVFDTKAHEQLMQKLEDLTKEAGDSEENIKKLESQLREVNHRLQKCRDRHSRQSSKKRILEEMDRKYEGYSYPVQELLNKGNELPGICGVVGDLLEVPEDYRVAVEVALGARINNIVTECKSDARKAIAFLKERNAGRLTFLPLDVLCSGESTAKLKSFPGTFSAAELVTVDNKYRAVADYLLGRTYVVEDLDTGLRLAEKTNFRFTIVTIQGEMLHPGGAITGGSLRKAAGKIIGRKSSVKELSREIAQLEESLVSLNEEKDNIEKTIAEQRDSLRLIGKRISQFSLRLQELETGVEYTERQVEALQREENLIRNEQDRLGELLEESHRSLARLVWENEKLERKIHRAAKITQKREKIINDLNASASRYSTALVNAEVKLSALKQKYEYTKQNIEQLNVLQSDMSARQEERKQDYEKSLEDKVLLDRKIREMEGSIESIRQQLSRLDKLQEELNRVSGALTKQEEHCTRVLRKISGEIRYLEHEFSNCRHREAALQNEVKRLDETMEENPCLRFLRIYTERAGLASLKNRANALRKQLAELEPVNISSIKEYSRVKIENAGFFRQLEDIEAARGHLKRVVRVVEGLMSREFRDFFSRLQITFNETYLRVFGGGRADLMLEGDDPLEGDIQISVQLPGKRTQSLMLLSGGEKALTALTLLFSILQENRSPFCILDEVDTSLDESNIEHFTRLIEYYSQFTQFIIVSHRQVTMEAAESLFGVTMPEEGVSSVVAINLEREAG